MTDSLDELDGEAVSEPARPGYETRDYEAFLDRFRRPIEPERLREIARGLLIFATPDDLSALQALAATGTFEDAAERIGLTTDQINARIRQVERRAAKRGWSPQHDNVRPVPPGYHLRGTSTLYRGDGSVAGQWVKTQIDKDHRLELLLEAIKAAAEPLRGGYTPQDRELADCHEDLLVVYPMGDPHVGMYAWAEEAGEDFDLEIAECDLLEAVDYLVSQVPPAKRAIVINVGDYFHADNMLNRTARSGHALDVDSRYAKVLRTGIRILRRIVEKALSRHEFVELVNVPGNHDDHSAIVLSQCLSLFYENDPRVRVRTEPVAYYYTRFGRNLIGATHGDKTKMSDLPSIMAFDRPEDWGQTDHRYWYTGHVHHESKKEYRGCMIESFRTLAARDAYHQSAGYRAGRDMKADVLHREWGRKSRVEVGILEIRDRLRRRASP